MKVGLVMPIDDESLGHIPSYREIRGLVRPAEAVGLDSVWAFDHLLFRFTDQPPTPTALDRLAEAVARYRAA